MRLHVRGPDKAASGRRPSSCAAPMRACPPAGDRLSEAARRDGGRAASGPRHDRRAAPRAAGLKNYWGYNSIGFFAPELRYSATATLGEFKTMVKTLHAAGIEVILDVVYNHTAEGDHTGPTLSFRGLDNAIYYRLDRAPPAALPGLHRHRQQPEYRPPRRAGLVMDSLRYWVQEMHVDGFRFDLAPTLARNAAHHFDRNGAFLSAIRQDPVLSRVKLIAERGTSGEDGYRLGNFPPGWVEWNDRYRDACSFWRGDAGTVGRASRLAGRATSSSARSPLERQFHHRARRLHVIDLVSYERKHNDANLEHNADGSDNNRSFNFGVEGPSDEPHIRRLPARERQKRNLLATVVFSQGPPCSSPATRSAAPSSATTTPIARTTRSHGSTGSSTRTRVAPTPREAIARPSGLRCRSYPRTCRGSRPKDAR